jgi:hypothetical protein
MKLLPLKIKNSTMRIPAVIRHSSFVIFPRSPFLLFPFALLLFTSCPEPTPPDYGLSLEAVDIVCTEATFKVSAGIDSTATWDCGLYRDDSLVISQSISGGSGYLRDTGLEPNASYNYHIGYLKEGKAKDRSQAVSITTLDTTSHDFSWTVETLGDYGSYLNDVAIVDENNIWVVGYITLGDSIYNAAHWDGNAWDMVHLPAVTYGGGLSMGWLTSIFAIDENNIWCFSSAGSYLKWDGIEWTSEWIPYRDGGINAIWASSPEDVWFAGDNGSIVHYDGSGFRRIESGTEVNYRQISGTPDGKYVFVAGYNYVLPTKTSALMIHNGVVTNLFYGYEIQPDDPNEFGYISAVDVYGSVAYFISFRGLWNYFYKDDHSIIDKRLSQYNFNRLIIQNPSDMVVIAGGFRYRVFNGIKWVFKDELYETTDYFTEQGDYKDDILVIVGIEKRTMRGLVARGRR